MEVMQNRSGVYFIKNIIDNKIYIGSSQNLRKRKNSHLCKLRKNKHHCSHLQYAFNKHGEDNFIFIEIEYTDNLLNREQYYLDNANHDLLYNTLKHAYAAYGEDHPMYGKRHSKESINKIKLARSRQTIKHSKETRQKISKGNKGKVFPKEAIDKMKATKKKNKRPAWNKGLTVKTSKSVAIGIAKITKKLDTVNVIKKYESGISMNALAGENKCSWDTIYNLLKRNNIKTRSISEQKIIRDKGVIK